MKLNQCKSVPVIHMGGNITCQLQAFEQGENGYTLNCLQAKAGDTSLPHHHPHLQVVYVIEGEGVFHAGDETQLIQAGDVVQIDSDVPHCFDTFTKDTVWLEFFTPVREDFLPKHSS